MTAEDRLLLLGARIALSGEARREFLAVVRGAPDWAAVLERSARHGTAPLLHAHLAVLDAAPLVPAAIRARLGEVASASWARNEVLVARWAEITLRLAAAGVPSLALKGIALVHTVYRDVGLRPMTDIDLLVRRADVPVATEVLRHAGYGTVGDAVEAVQAFDGFRLFARDSTLVDLHWAITYSSVRTADVIRVDHDGLWGRARHVTADGMTWATLSAEDMLLHLALHVTIGSGFARLIWFSDVDALVRTAALDWDQVIREAERWRVRAILGYVLGVTHGAFDTPIPVEIRRRLRPARVRRAMIGACVGTATPPVRPEALGATRVYLAETLLMDRVRDVLRLLWRSVAPPAAWMRLHYALPPGSRALLHRLLVHPARVFYLALSRLT